MKNKNNLFLHLLSAALWDRPAEAVRFNGLDGTVWKDIAAIAHKQSVNALVADKALSLPAESLPPRAMRMQWLMQIEQTRILNLNMERVLGELVQEYEQAGFPFVLMKGLACGAQYPNPLLRNPGDIDVWLYRAGDYEKARVWAAGQGYQADDAGHIHYNYQWKGIVIEPHCRISYFDRRKYNKKFAEWEQEVAEQARFGRVPVQLLPVTLNAFFLFHHMFRHFASLGVGFRQFCDWVLFLKHYHREIDRQEFTERVRSFGLLYPMQVFARAAVEYLDASEEIFPFPLLPERRTRRHVRRVVTDMLKNGNFGFHRPGKKRPAEKYSGMWFSFILSVKRSLKFATLSVSHVLIVPYKKLSNRLKIGFQ